MFQIFQRIEWTDLLLEALWRHWRSPPDLLLSPERIKDISPRLTAEVEEVIEDCAMIGISRHI